MVFLAEAAANVIQIISMGVAQVGGVGSEAVVTRRVAAELAGTNLNPAHSLIIDAPKSSLFNADGRMNIGPDETNFLLGDIPEVNRDVVPLKTNIFMQGGRYLFANAADGLPYSMGYTHSEHGVLGAGGEIVDFATIPGIKIEELRDENKVVRGFLYELPQLTKEEIRKLVPENIKDNYNYGEAMNTFSENAQNTLGIRYVYGLSVDGKPEIQASYFNATQGSAGGMLLTVELHQVIADVSELSATETSGIAVVNNGNVSMLPTMEGWQSIEYMGPKSWVLTDSNGVSYSFANKSWQKIDATPPTPNTALTAEIITSVEKALPGFTVSGDRLNDRNGNLVPDLKIATSKDGKTWTGGSMPPYKFAFDGVNYKIPYATILTPEQFTETADGRLCMPAFCQNEKGQWERMKVLDPEGKETESPKYSKMESMVMMLEATTKAGKLSLNRATKANTSKLIGFTGNNPYITYEGTRYNFKSGKFIGNDELYIVDGNGKPIKDTNGNITRIPMVIHDYAEVNPDGQSYLVFENNGEKVEVFIDGKLGDIKYYGVHDGVGPFAMTQEEYDAVMASLTLGE